VRQVGREGREGREGMRLRPCQRPQARSAPRARWHRRVGVGPHERVRKVRQLAGLCSIALVGLLVFGLFTASIADDTARVRAWRTQHERQILNELFEFLSLPNVAANKTDVQRNAAALVAMFAKRHFTADVVPTAGAPLVFAERKAPNARRTVAFYFHYDGQPVVASEWIYNPPFSPIIVVPHAPAGRTISLETFEGAIDPEWRIYARSSSDDKSPIVALLSAVDALDAAGLPLASNVRVVLEGEEEAGSPNLEAALREHGDRIKADALFLVDGPRHASGRATMNFGSRGLMPATITVYGAARDLHSGNYGNWAPNPALDLARLLASMKDDRGRVTIDGFYDDVVPLTASEKKALDKIPDVELTLMQAYGFSRRENPSERLELRHNQPTLNVNALEAGGGVGGQGRTIIPASASARIDVRLVKAIDPAKEFDRIVAHVRKQGYFVVDKEPDAAMRAAHPMLARVTRVGGYPAGRTSMDTPLAASVSNALAAAAGGPIVRLPTLGGSTPFYLFADTLKIPTFGLSIVNFDNNQHGPNENLRIGNLWEGIESMAALLRVPLD
jgi:acetylornithine deacetylase/succinyl-diaminopimelate desuccinylase-like protein